MSVAQTTACQNLATQLIHDRKLEIQENAARTLAGMLKGLTPEAFVELKDSLLKQLDEQAPPHASRREIGKLRSLKNGSRHSIFSPIFSHGQQVYCQMHPSDELALKQQVVCVKSPCGPINTFMLKRAITFEILSLSCWHVRTVTRVSLNCG